MKKSWCVLWSEIYGNSMQKPVLPLLIDFLTLLPNESVHHIPVKAKTQNTCVSCLKSDPASLVSRTVFSSRPSLLVRDLSLSRLSLSLSLSRNSLSFSHSGNGIGTGASSTCSLLSVFLTLIFSSSCCNFLFAA